ncbi:MAG: hypothetical protein ABIS66_06200 [Sphingomicrobium sp.]
MLAALVMAGAAPAQTGPKPLFAGSDILHLTIKGPINQIARSAQQSRVPHAAAITVQGAAPETLPIQLSPRGITRLRRETCQFPPLRVAFSSRPGPGSLFAGQKRLKLVTHCRPAASFQQFLLLEYATYLVYNQLTPLSHRVRLATIDYVDDADRPITTRFGFFLEDIDDVAARNGLRSGATPDRISSSQLSSADAARVALFEYMIGNMDWSMRAGPAGEGCCHNSHLLTRAGAPALVPVPYDFDFSGLVDAPYAVSPDGNSTVRQRHYMGFCRHNAEALAAAAAFRSQRGQLIAALNRAPLEERTRQKAIAYLSTFYSDIADDRSTAAKVLKTCG